MIYTFNNIVVDTDAYILWSSGKETSVEPQVFNLIVYLIQNKGKTVTRDDLLAHVWKGRIVSDTSINNNIKSARKVLGDDGTKQRVIKTIHSRGYQFIAITDTARKSELRASTDSISLEKSVEQFTFAREINALRKVKTALFASKPRRVSAFFLLAIIIGAFVLYSTEFVTVKRNIKNNEIESAMSFNHKMVAQQSIAVLPFANTKPDSGSDYLSFALASQIIGDLSYLEKFYLSPAGSISKYANQVIDPIAIGQELKVDYVISGNYLVESNTIRLNIELIEVNSNHLVWREAMQVDYADTFALQDMVAKKVAKGLGVGFRHNFTDQQRRDIPSSALAFEYYLRGISYPQSNDGHKMAVEMLRKSIDLDPEYAPSYAHLGFHRRLLEQHGRIISAGLETAEWYYLKALELNPALLEALSNLSGLYVETNRTEEALLIARKMLDINPNDASTHFALSYIYRYAGMLDESIEEAETALAISPDNSRFRSIVAVYVSAGRYEDALEKVYLDNGDYGTGYSGMIAFKQGKLSLASKLFKQVIKIDQNGIWGLIAKFYLAVIQGQPEVGLEVLSKIADGDIVDGENMYYLAEFYALLKEKEESLNMLEQAINSGYFNYPYISTNSSFEFLQDESRYIEALNKARQRHEAFRANFL